MEEVKLIVTKSELAAGTRGASLGFDALKTACLDKGSDYFALYDIEEVEDLNDLLFEEYEYEHAKYIEGVLEMEERMSEATFQTIKGGYFPIILAGDHSTAAGSICGIKKAHPEKRLGVIWIDAHADLHSPYTTPSGNMHGMPLAMVCGVDNLGAKVNNPPEEVIEMWEKLKNVGIDLVQLVSLTSTPERIEKLTKASEGFIYAVTVNGITGARSSFEGDLESHFKKIQSYTDTPVLAGFGISTPDQVKQFGAFSSGVIVGSKIVDCLAKNDWVSIENLVKASKFTT